MAKRKVNAKALLIATGQNLKRLLRKGGWGASPVAERSPRGSCRAPITAAVTFLVAFTRLIIARRRSAVIARRRFDLLRRIFQRPPVVGVAITSVRYGERPKRENWVA